MRPMTDMIKSSESMESAGGFFPTLQIPDLRNHSDCVSFQHENVKSPDKARWQNIQCSLVAHSMHSKEAYTYKHVYTYLGDE